MRRDDYNTEKCTCKKWRILRSWLGDILAAIFAAGLIIELTVLAALIS